MKSSVMAVGLGGFAVWVYYYSIWSVRQDDLTVEFLEQVEAIEKARALD
jgi:type VI protein secretion system component VasF